MNKEELERLLEEQANASRKSKGININRDKIRKVLNIVFLILALIGLIIYFSQSTTLGLIVIGVSLVFKIIEFLFRFLL